jgi:hypothetical protein
MPALNPRKKVLTPGTRGTRCEFCSCGDATSEGGVVTWARAPWQAPIRTARTIRRCAAGPNIQFSDIAIVAVRKAVASLGDYKKVRASAVELKPLPEGAAGQYQRILKAVEHFYP